MFSNARKTLYGVGLGLAVAFASLAPSAADAGAMSNYLVNKDIDYIMRAQAYTAPTTVYIALETAAGTSAGCGTEETGTGYARVAVTSSLTNWAGTQAAASTAVSSGTTGTTSNNAAITFGSPTASWGTVTGFCVMDASTAGNLLWRANLTTSKTINSGDAAPSFAISALTWTIN